MKSESDKPRHQVRPAWPRGARTWCLGLSDSDFIYENRSVGGGLENRLEFGSLLSIRLKVDAPSLGIRWRALERDSNGRLSRNYRAGCGKSEKTSGQNVNTEEKVTLEFHRNLFIRTRVGSELASVVDVLLACRQNQHPEVVQSWRRGCPPSRGPLGTCSNPSGKVRTLPFTVADSTPTQRQSWRSRSPQNSRHLRASIGLSTNTRSQPNSIPHGQSSLWCLLVTRGGRFSYSRTLAVSHWIGFLSGTRGNRSVWRASCASLLV